MLREAVTRRRMYIGNRVTRVDRLIGVGKKRIPRKTGAGRRNGCICEYLGELEGGLFCVCVSGICASQSIQLAGTTRISECNGLCEVSPMGFDEFAIDHPLQFVHIDDRDWYEKTSRSLFCFLFFFFYFFVAFFFFISSKH